jgi:hypothetical protein
MCIQEGLDSAPPAKTLLAKLPVPACLREVIVNHSMKDAKQQTMIMAAR